MSSVTAGPGAPPVPHRPGSGRASTLKSLSLPKPIPTLEPGDRVLHTHFGMGSVVAVSGRGDTTKADVDFGSHGVKRLSLKHAPMEKL